MNLSSFEKSYQGLMNIVGMYSDINKYKSILLAKFLIEKANFKDVTEIEKILKEVQDD